jgi:hypothetical protein
MQSALEEMVRAFDHDQLLRFGQFGYQRFQFGAWPELVARTANQKLRLRTIAQEVERINPRLFRGLSHRRYRESDSDRRNHPQVPTCGAQADGSPERESGEDKRQMIRGIHPIEGGTNIVDFSSALIVLAMTQSGAAKVKTQNRESEAVQCFHGVKNDLVVQRAAKQRMRMSHHGRVRRIFGTSVEQRLKPARRALEEEGSDRRVRGTHCTRVAKPGPRASDLGPQASGSGDGSVADVALLKPEV